MFKIELNQATKRFVSEFDRLNLKDILVAVFIIGFSSWLMSSTFAYDSGQLLIARKAWSDFGAHLPLIRSFSLGDNLPPEYPQFAGPKIKYHYLFYLLVAGLERLGFNIVFSLNLLSICGLSLFLWMLYQTAHLVIKDRNGAMLALYLFLFNSSLSFVDFFKEYWGQGSLINSWLSLKEFVNFGPWNGDVVSAFWNWNILTNQRHLGMSFGLVLVLVWPVLRAVYQKKSDHSQSFNIRFWLWIIWLGLILLPFLHQAGYVLAVMFILGWFLLNPKLLETYGPVYFWGLLFSAPGFFYFLGGDEISWQPGFLAQNQNIFSIIRYWFFNLGLYWVLWPILFVAADKADRKLLVVFSSFFVLANLFRLSPDMINNHKLINFFLVGIVILVAKMVVKWWDQGKAVRVFLVGVIFFASLSGWVDAMPIVNDSFLTVTDPRNLPIGRWVQAETKADATFVTSSYLYHPVSLVGRKTFLDYGYFAWSLGYADKERRKYLPKIFSDQIEPEEWCRLMTKLELDYVSINLNRIDLNKVEPKQSWLYQTQEPVYRSPAGYEIFSVSQICSNSK